MERDFQETVNGADPGTTRIRRSPAYIQYNPRRDLPILLAIRNATFICHRQLWDHISARGIETCRRSFNWRIRRLTDAGIVQKLLPLFPYPGPVYTITRAGLACLEACGEGLVSLTSESKTLADTNQIQHYLELAEIHAALRRTNLLVEWTGDLEVRSINLSIDVPLAKDYDAIADLEFEGARYRIAIEYERSLKSSKRYQEIISAIASERQIHLVLYLTSSVDLLYQLKSEFDGQTFPIALALSHGFCQNPLAARLYLADAINGNRTTLPSVLRSLAMKRHAEIRKIISSGFVLSQTLNAVDAWQFPPGSEQLFVFQ